MTTKGGVLLNSIDLIILNFDEVRRRSVNVWTSIPEEKLKWKPDDEAMNCTEMIRRSRKRTLLSPSTYK